MYVPLALASSKLNKQIMALNVVCVGLRTPRGSANVVVDKSISVEILKHRVSPDQVDYLRSSHYQVFKHFMLLYRVPSSTCVMEGLLSVMMT